AFGITGQHGEARAAYESVLALAQTPAQRAILRNNIAYSIALEGDGALAAERMRELIAERPPLTEQNLALCYGTLGIALVVAKEPEGAKQQLEEAIAMGGTSRSQAIRFYYLGDALRALGRLDEARGAYAKVSAEPNAGSWATRANAALASMKSAYR